MSSLLAIFSRQSNSKGTIALILLEFLTLPPLFHSYLALHKLVIKLQCNLQPIYLFSFSLLASDLLGAPTIDQHTGRIAVRQAKITCQEEYLILRGRFACFPRLLLTILLPRLKFTGVLHCERSFFRRGWYQLH